MVIAALENDRFQQNTPGGYWAARIKAMVPIEGTDATDLERVPGVGVSAVIDIKL